MLLLALAFWGCGSGDSAPRPIDAAAEGVAAKEDAGDDLLDRKPDSEADAEVNGGPAEPVPASDAGNEVRDASAEVSEVAIHQDAAAVDTKSDVAVDLGPQTPACLAKRTQEYRVVFQGSGFDAFEGKTVIGRTADGSSAARCLAVGTTQIQGGAFHLEVLNLSSGVYPFVDAFIDLGEDGACDANIDPSWRRAEVIVGRPLMENLTPNDLVERTTCGFVN